MREKRGEMGKVSQGRQKKKIESKKGRGGGEKDVGREGERRKNKRLLTNVSCTMLVPFTKCLWIFCMWKESILRQEILGKVIKEGCDLKIEHKKL